MARKGAAQSRNARGDGRLIEVMDTTLRDGEQAEGISMMPQEKLTIARRLLKDVNVDRIEVASARSSEGERTAVRRIVEWADSSGYVDRVEVLGFVDFAGSLDWARTVGARALTLDHVVPLIRGGRSVRANMVPACKDCNSQKQSLPPWEWDAYLAARAPIDTSPE